MTTDEVRKLLLRQAKPYAKRRKGSTGQRAWCVEHGVCISHVSDFMSGNRAPPLDMMEALGLEWRIVKK